jgi:hypothetical protein
MYLNKNLPLAFVVPLIGTAFAQTPPEFQPEVDTSIDIAYSGADVTKSGELLAISSKQPVTLPTLLTLGIEVATAPNITVSPNVTAVANSTGLLIMMDLDMSAPNGTVMSNSSSTFTTFLNWLATDIDLTASPLSISNDQGAPYFPPSPLNLRASPFHKLINVFLLR